MKKTYMTLTPIALVATMMMSQAYADQAVLQDVVVTATPMTSPLVVETDPKLTKQPLPAHDGGDYLKTIPGFSIQRKAGADGEVNFRGLSGSRVNILVDNESVVGGCSYRMDGPTAYIYPELYDKLTIVKGPQTVLYQGNGSAATVHYEKDVKEFKEPGYDLYASGLVGSFGRHDEVVDANVGNSKFFANISGSNSESNDYKDGAGNKVRSAYRRYTGGVTIGTTPNENVRTEFSATRSDGYALYADRAMDGKQLKRDNYSAKISVKNVSDRIEKVQLSITKTLVDQIMDSITYRLNPIVHVPANKYEGSQSMKHDVTSVRATADVRLTQSTKAIFGIDSVTSTHSKDANPHTQYGASDRNFADDSKFSNVSLFGEFVTKYSNKDLLKYGYRADIWEVKDLRPSSHSAWYDGHSDTSGQKRTETTNSGFVRYENKDGYMPNATTYVGVGRNERMPDYWELITNKRVGNNYAGYSNASAMQSTKTEKTNQLDFGILSQGAKSSMGISGFYSKVQDFVLIDYSSGAYWSDYGVVGTTRNINATLYGGELTSSYQLANNLKSTVAGFYTKGTNDTDNLPLAQVAPLEGRLSLVYDDKTYTLGGLMRVVAAKTSYSVGQGSISGKDIGATGGFSIFSLHAGYKPNKKVNLIAGVDNIFDKNYAEFISRAGSNNGSAIGGYPVTTRVNEPGRTAWLKATIALD
jgi:iron complex outermembrane receptor protein